MLDNRWYIPLYNFPMVYGYSPRVAGHPHRPYTTYMFDFWRIALKD